jgi:hypothetical protein
VHRLRPEPPDLEEVRQMVYFIASDGKRAAQIVIRLQALIEKVLTADYSMDGAYSEAALN